MSRKIEKEKFDLSLEDLIVVLVGVDETIEDINAKGCELLECSIR